MLNHNNLQRLLLRIIGFEGLTALILTATIPGEKSSNLLNRFSSQRLAILMIIAIISITFFLLSWNDENAFRKRLFLFNSLRKFAKIQFFISIILLFFLFFPPYIFINNYQAQFIRLFFLAALIAIINFEIMIFNCIIAILDVGAIAFFHKVGNIINPALPWILCIIFPILFMTPRLWVFGNHQYSIGNDFVPFSYYYKVYLLDYLIHFKLPIWSPSEAAGFPFLTSPQTGALYPLNLLFAFLYWWKGSYSLLDHVWVTVFGISIYCLGLFAWLREFKWKQTFALIASLIVSVSYQLTEIIRFTKAVESVAWIPWLLFFFTRILKNPTKQRSFWFYVCFSFSVFSFLTAGYLYYQYYSIFLLIPLAIILVINRARIIIGFGGINLQPKFFIRPFIAFISPFILLTPYFVQMFILLQQVHRRGARDFFYSTEHTFSWIDHLGSLVFPPIASPEGWYYLGILPLALVLFYFLASKEDYEENATLSVEKEWFLSLGVKTVLGLAIMFVILISIGKNSPLFYIFWHYFPFFYGFRYWGRFTIMLIPIVAFILTASMETIFNRLNQSVDRRNNNLTQIEIGKWVFILLVIIFLSFYSHAFPIGEQWKISFYLVNSRIWIYSVSLIVSIFFILTVLWIVYKNYLSKRIIKFLFITYFLICILNLWPIGAFQWMIDIIPENNPPRVLNIAEKVIPFSFNFPRTYGKTNISISPAFSIGPSPDWYFESYFSFFYDHSFEEIERDILLGRDKNGNRLFLSSKNNYETVKEFLNDSSMFGGAIDIQIYNGELLDLKIESNQEGYLNFIDNWDPFWIVKVNGQTAELEKLFKTFKSVKIPSGKSTILFEYKPEFFPLEQIKQLIIKWY